MHLRCLLLLLLIGCGPSSDEDPNATAAEASLARRGLTDIALERVDDRTFDFTAQSAEGEACAGTVMVNPGRSQSTAAMRIECE